MRLVKFILVGVALLAIALVVIGQMGLLSGTPPNGLGVNDGRLMPPARTPNSVSSQADLYPDHPQRQFARIDPIRFNGAPEQALARIAAILQASDDTVIVTNGPDYVYAQCTTKLMRFTDDIEFWLDRSAGVIQVRSASRLGKKRLWREPQACRSHQGEVQYQLRRNGDLNAKSACSPDALVKYTQVAIDSGAICMPLAHHRTFYAAARSKRQFHQPSAPANLT